MIQLLPVMHLAHVAGPPLPKSSLSTAFTHMIVGNLAVIFPMLFTMSCGRFWYAHRPIYKSSCKTHDVVPMANLCQKSNPAENLSKKEKRRTIVRTITSYETNSCMNEKYLGPKPLYVHWFNFRAPIPPQRSCLITFTRGEKFCGITGLIINYLSGFSVHNLLPYLITKLANNKDFHDMCLAKPII